jgi:hypothetical protein
MASVLLERFGDRCPFESDLCLLETEVQVYQCVLVHVLNYSISLYARYLRYLHNLVLTVKD